MKQTPSILTAAFFVTLTLAGCIGTEASLAVPTVHDQESASYDVRTASGTWLGAAHFDVERRPDGLHVDLVVDHGDMEERTHSVFDIRSGRLIQVDGGSTTSYAWGAMAQMPLPRLFPDSVLLSRTVLALGPQWAVMAQASHTWGELDVAIRQDAAAWHVTATAPCQSGCPYNPDAPPIEWQATLSGDRGLLPQTARIGHAGADGAVVLERTQHRISGAPFVFDHRSPATPDPTDLTRCGLLPCEGPAWPEHLRFTEAFQALQDDAQWQAWSEQHPDAFLLWMRVNPPAEDTLNGIAVEAHRSWDFSFASVGGASTFWADVGESSTAGFSLNGVAVRDSRVMELDHPEMWAVSPDVEVMSLGDAGVSMAGEQALDAVVGAVWKVQNPLNHPDPRAQYSLTLQWDQEPGGKAMGGSAWDGQPHWMRG